jgi:hypothetical protein
LQKIKNLNQKRTAAASRIKHFNCGKFAGVFLPKFGCVFFGFYLSFLLIKPAANRAFDNIFGDKSGRVKNGILFACLFACLFGFLCLWRGLLEKKREIDFGRQPSKDVFR